MESRRVYIVESGCVDSKAVGVHIVVECVHSRRVSIYSENITHRFAVEHLSFTFDERRKYG